MSDELTLTVTLMEAESLLALFDRDMARRLLSEFTLADIVGAQANVFAQLRAFEFEEDVRS